MTGTIVELQPLKSSKDFPEEQYSESSRITCYCQWAERGGQERPCACRFLLVKKPGWAHSDAASDLKHQNKSRVDMIREAGDGNCVDTCDGLWLRCADEVFVNNKIHSIVCATALRDFNWFTERKTQTCNFNDRATNCAKTFMFKLLELLFLVLLRTNMLG